MAPPTKKRKKSPTAVQEITFDSSAREDYLTGFHKRKVQRIKHAQEEAAKKDREERVRERKRVSRGSSTVARYTTDPQTWQMRDERKADLEKHVETVNAMLREAHGTASELQEGQSGSEMEEWERVADPPDVDHEAEYIDEDRFTTVTVEAINVSKEGIHKVMDTEEMDITGQKGADQKPGADGGGDEGADTARKGKRRWTKENPDGHLKKKKKKFRYESKAERKVTRYKERSGNKSKARARKE